MDSPSYRIQPVNTERLNPRRVAHTNPFIFQSSTIAALRVGAEFVDPYCSSQQPPQKPPGNSQLRFMLRDSKKICICCYMPSTFRATLYGKYLKYFSLYTISEKHLLSDATCQFARYLADKSNILNWTNQDRIIKSVRR